MSKRRSPGNPYRDKRKAKEKRKYEDHEYTKNKRNKTH